MDSNYTDSGYTVTLPGGAPLVVPPADIYNFTNRAGVFMINHTSTTPIRFQLYSGLVCTSSLQFADQDDAWLVYPGYAIQRFQNDLNEQNRGLVSRIYCNYTNKPVIFKMYADINTVSNDCPVCPTIMRKLDNSGDVSPSGASTIRIWYKGTELSYVIPLSSYEPDTCPSITTVGAVSVWALNASGVAVLTNY
jgi:hypothetical protein